MDNIECIDDNVVYIEDNPDGIDDELNNEDILSVSKKLINSSYLQTNDLYKSEIVLDEELKSSFLWNIHNFSEWVAQGNIITSQDFKIDEGCPGVSWYIELYPKGSKKNSEEHVSIYLVPKFQIPIKLRTAFTIYLFNKQNSVIFSRKQICIFNKTGYGYGWDHFIRQKTIFNKETNILNNDKLTILCTIRASKVVDSHSKTINVSDIIDSPSYKKIKLADHNYVSDIKGNRTWKNLHEDKSYSDVTLIIDKQEIKAHKCVLAAASPVFSEILKNDETAVNCIEIMDISLEAMNEMMRFIYINEVENLHNIAHELIAVSNKYMINDLKSLCEATLCGNIDYNNIGKMILIADSCNAEKLMNSAVDFIINNKSEFKKNPEYEQIIFSCPRITKQLLLSLV